jgi:hypothetical protein
MIHNAVRHSGTEPLSSREVELCLLGYRKTNLILTTSEQTGRRSLNIVRTGPDARVIPSEWQTKNLILKRADKFGRGQDAYKAWFFSPLQFFSLFLISQPVLSHSVSSLESVSVCQPTITQTIMV